MQIEVGKIYKNGKLSREVTKIEDYEIYYRTETGKDKHCWITTFEGWVAKGQRPDGTKLIYDTLEKLRNKDNDHIITGLQMKLIDLTSGSTEIEE